MQPHGCVFTGQRLTGHKLYEYNLYKMNAFKCTKVAKEQHFLKEPYIYIENMTPRYVKASITATTETNETHLKERKQKSHPQRKTEGK